MTKEVKFAHDKLIKAIAEASAAYQAKLAAAELTPEAKIHAELKERVRILNAERNALIAE